MAVQHPSAAPQAVASALREVGFGAEHTREQIRYAPHIVFLRQLERVDEAMAALKDPYPAFEAWVSGLLPWAREQSEFWADYDRLSDVEDELFADYGSIPVLEYVALWRPAWIDVMRRAGMFKAMEEGKASQQAPSESVARTMERMGLTGEGGTPSGGGESA